MKKRKTLEKSQACSSGGNLFFVHKPFYSDKYFFKRISFSKRIKISVFVNSCLKDNCNKNIKYFKNIWYFVLHSTKIFPYICIANNSVFKSSFFKKVLYNL